jgi:hypothetical protein
MTYGAKTSHGAIVSDIPNETNLIEQNFENAVEKKKPNPPK